MKKICIKIGICREMNILSFGLSAYVDDAYVLEFQPRFDVAFDALPFRVVKTSVA